MMREKVILIIFPRKDGELLVSAEPDFPYTKIPELKELVEQPPA